MNFVHELAEVAKSCPRPLVAKLVKDAAITLSDALDVLEKERSKEAMIAVNGAWIHAVRVLDTVPPLGGDDLNGGAVRLNEDQRKAA